MRTCPNCGKKLTDEMIKVNMCWECGYILDIKQVEDDDSVAKMQRVDLENRIKENQKRAYATSIGRKIEYGVDTVVTNGDGYTDAEDLEAVLNGRVENGWYLKSAYSNKLGENAIRVLGFGVNSTVSQTVLIFERELEG